MVKDLTCGNPRKVLWQFTIPMFVSVIFQQLYNIADSIIAGKFAGEDALAAVGASYPITMIFMAIAIGSNIGCSVVISNLFGGKQYKKMKTAVYTTVIVTFVFAIVLTHFGLLGSDFLLNIVNTPDNIFEQAGVYLNIYIGGFVFLYLYNVATGIFSALGDSNTPLYLLIGSSLGNIVLDYIFVRYCGWGVAGVAWATFIAQGIAGLIAIILMQVRLKQVHTEGRIVFFSPSMLKKICAIAIPSILQQSFVSIGNIFIQSIINGYGSSVIAGYSAAIKLNTFTITSFTTLGNGMSNYTAQNLGAGKEDRIKSGFKAGMILTLSIAIPFTIAYLLFGKALVGLFLDGTGVKALNTGVEFLLIVSPFYIVVATKLIADGVLRGAGAMKYFMTTTFTDLLLRVILAYVFSARFEIVGVWLSWPVGWVLSTLLSVIFYGSGVWKINRKKYEKVV